MILNNYSDMSYDKPLWYSEDKPVKLTKGELLKLHSTYVHAEISHLDFFYKYRNVYISFLLAIMAAFTTIFLQNTENVWLLLLCIFPISMMILSYIGLGSTDRYYQRFLEASIMIAKIENLLQIDFPPVSSKLGKPLKSPWPSDTNFNIERFIESRFNHCYKTSAEWRDAMMKVGDNKWSHCTFWFFFAIGAGLSLVTLVTWLVHVQSL